MAERAKLGNGLTSTRLRNKLQEVFEALDGPTSKRKVPENAVKARALLKRLRERLEKRNSPEYKIRMGLAPTAKQLEFMMAIHSQCLNVPGYNPEIDLNTLNQEQIQEYIETWRGQGDATEKQMEYARRVSEASGRLIPVDSNGRHTRKSVSDFLAENTRRPDVQLFDDLYKFEQKQAFDEAW